MWLRVLRLVSLLTVVTSQLVVNVKNNGGEVFKESIHANTSLDTIILEFQKTDGTSVTQFIDYKNAGLIRRLEKTVSNVAHDVTGQMEHIQKDVSREVDKVWSSPLLDNFKNGNVIQLVSRSSGFCLQIVISPNGYLVVDAQWTVINEGKNMVRLHNNNNYLATVNGTTVVESFPPPAQPGPETKFLASVHGNFITLESIKEPGRHIGILSNGQLKSALATGKENDADFAPKLMYSPHDQAKQQSHPK